MVFGTVYLIIKVLKVIAHYVVTHQRYYLNLAGKATTRLSG